MNRLTDEEINNARAKTIGLPLVCRQQHRDIAQAQLSKCTEELNQWVCSHCGHKMEVSDV
jgi:rubrerythrin